MKLAFFMQMMLRHDTQSLNKQKLIQLATTVIASESPCNSES